jgi:tRNA 2-thiouridine synthesizing protein A
MSLDQPIAILDFRTTKCPLNFVKTRLALEKIPMNSLLEVWISAASESVMNIPKSIQAEGHRVVKQEPLEGDPDGVRLWIEKLK